METAGGLIAMTRTEFAVTQGEVPVAAQAGVKDLDVAGAVHGFDRVIPVL